MVDITQQETLEELLSRIGFDGIISSGDESSDSSDTDSEVEEEI